LFENGYRYGKINDTKVSKLTKDFEFVRKKTLLENEKKSLEG